MYADYLFDYELSPTGKVRCANSLIDCSERLNPHLFQLDNDELENSNIQNSLKWGQILTAGNQLISKTNMYILKLNLNGALTLTQGQTKIWSNEMGIFINETKQTEHINNIRVRINEKGHLVEEVKGRLLFSNFNNNTYRSNEWVVVWSSAPIHHNVTIGIFKTPDNHKSYRMVLEESGNLMLYDAVGALIWCSESKCNHRFGYQFPEVYLVPTNMITPFIENDKHNSIDSNVYRANKSSIQSLSKKNCDSAFLMSNEAIVSPNGRFKLILEESGNLIIKDEYRTMWESSSGFLPFAEGPFQLILSPFGYLHVLDKNKLIVWNAIVDAFQNFSGPFVINDTWYLNFRYNNKL